MTAYQFVRPWLSLQEGDQSDAAFEFANLRRYLKGVDDGSVSLFNPNFLNFQINGSSFSLPVSIANGGTNSTTSLNNGRVMGSSGGKIVELVLGQIPGTATNDDASAGNIGEYVESTGQSTVNFPASGSLSDISSLSLTAGDWDISFLVYWGKNGAVVTSFQFGVGTVVGNDNSNLQNGISAITAGSTTIGVTQVDVLPPYRVSLSGSSTRYFKLSASYSVATPQYFGFKICARRVR